MQTKTGQYGVYRNKPKKMRQYLLQKGNYLRDIIKDPKKSSIHRSLEKDQFRQLHLNKQLKSSLVELVASTRKRIQTERSNLPERPSNQPININKIKKQNLKLEESTSNEPISKQLKIIRREPELDKKSPAHHNPASSRQLKLSLGSTERRSNHQTLDFSTSKNQRYTQRSRPQKKSSERVLNFSSKNRSLLKMSVQLLGQHRQEDFIQGFVREKRIGKGGFSLVWQALHLSSGKKYAVKQIDANNQYQTHLAEITFSSFFFLNGQPKAEFKNHPGIHGLLTMYNYHLVGDKVYIIYEKCTASLGEFLFDIFQQTEIKKSKQQKSYIILHKPLYAQMRISCQFLKRLIFNISQSLDLLYKCNIIHSDIKTSNILINLSENKKQYSFKLIDYGSSFFFENLTQYRLATPEYIPPELINFLSKQKGKPYNKDIIQYTEHYDNPSAIDMWGLGCILLEIVHGIPLWLSNKVKIKIDGVEQSKCGIFATENRSYSEILKKQLELIKNIDIFLVEENNINVLLDKKLRIILKRCLSLNPSTRIKPNQAIQILSPDFQ